MDKQLHFPVYHYICMQFSSREYFLTKPVSPNFLQQKQCPHSHNLLSTLTQRIVHTHTMDSSSVTHYFAIYSPPSFKQHFKHTVSVHWTYPTMICDVKLKCRLPRHILPSICLECNVQVLKNLVSQFYIWDQWIKNV